MKIDWNEENPSKALVVETADELKEENPDLFKKALALSREAVPKYCQVCMYKSVLSGTFVVPQREHPIKTQFSFGFILTDQSLYMIGDPKVINSLLMPFMSTEDEAYKSPLLFLLEFMNFMIRQDVYFLEEYNTKLEKIEEELFEGKGSGMNHYIMDTRKDMAILGSYYRQLNAMAQTLEEVSVGDQKQDIAALISVYESRVQMLLSLVETIKDYTSQIWTLRQTQLSDQQNKVSTLLTIITTIFLPLTLITGWFGMNFTYLPFIKTRSGYYLIMSLCAVIIIGELIFIYRTNRKRKKED